MKVQSILAFSDDHVEQEVLLGMLVSNSKD